MKNLFSADILLSFFFCLLGMIILTSVCFWFLRKQKFLVKPYNGMEWPTVLFSSSILLGAFQISCTFIEPAFKSFKVYNTYKEGGSVLFKNCLTLFSQFFVIAFILTGLYLLVLLIISLLLPGEKKVKTEIQEGNAAVCILLTAIAIGLGFMFREIGTEVMKPLVPYVINFR